MKKLANFLGNLQYKYSSIFIIATLVFTIIIAFGAINLISNVEPSLEKVLPQDIDEIKLMNSMRDEFPADIIYIVLEINGEGAQDVRDPKVLEYIYLLDSKIAELPNVHSIVSLSKMNNDFKIVRGTYDLPNNIVESKNLFNRYSESFGVDKFLSSDFKVTYIEVHTSVGSSASSITEMMNNIEQDINSLEEFNPGVDVSLSGFSAIDKATFNIIISDFIKITFISFAFILTILFISKRSLKGFVPLIVVMLAVIWTMGLVGYIGITITVVTMVSVAMIMGLGIDYGIHMSDTYYENRTEYGKRKSLIVTLEELLRSLIGSSLTTSAGFLALLFGMLPAMKNLGIVLAIGISFTLMAAIISLPAFLIAFDKDKQEEKQEN